jgi:hypothetical protein
MRSREVSAVLGVIETDFDLAAGTAESKKTRQSRSFIANSGAVRCWRK